MTSSLKNYAFYHGCYNSFVLCEYEEGIDYSASGVEYCESYDLDGLIAYKESESKEYDFEMVFYNKDGSVGLMCGNGIRCLVKYAYDLGYINANTLLHIKTLSGIREAIITSLSPFIVKVNLGKCDYNYNKLSIDNTKIDTKNDEVFDYKIRVDNKNYSLSAVFMTNHHAVVLLKDENELNQILESDIGKNIQESGVFKDGVNVDFVYIIDRKNIKVRTFERGVGWTLACATGAAASFCVLNRMGKIKDEVSVHFFDGKINVIKDINNDIYIEGSAEVLTY